MRRSSGAAAHPVAPFIYGSLDDMLSRLCTCREGIEWVWPSVQKRGTSRCVHHGKNPGVVERDLELFKRIDLLKRPRASVRTRPELACEPSLGLEAMRGAAISVALLMRCGGASGSCSLRAGRVGRGRSIAWTLPRPAPAPAALGRSGWCGGVMARTAGCGSGTQKCCVSSCRCEHPAREVRCWSVLWG